MARKKAVIYARQSSGKEEESESIAMQLERCVELARKHNLEIVGQFSDANTSGRLYPEGAENIIAMDIAYQKWHEKNSIEKKCRPGLRKVLNLLPLVEVLVVYDMTRLYRPVQNSFLQSFIDSQLVESGVHVLTVKDGETNPSDFSDSLVTTIKSHVNDNQIKLTSEKARLAMKKLKDDGYLPTGAHMYGIRYIGGKSRKVEVIPEQAEVIRFVFEQTLKLKPYNWIVREMNRLFGDRTEGKTFYGTSFRHIISQPFYCGFMYDSHGALIPARQMQGQEIIPYETWEAANDIVNDPNRIIRHCKNMPHPFSGILVCGYCGSKMLVGMDGNKEYYHCISVQTKGMDNCRQARVTMNIIRESKVFTGLKKAIAPLLVLSLFKDLEHQEVLIRRTSKLPKLKEMLVNYETRLTTASDDYIEGRMGLDAFHVIEQMANIKIKAVKNEILQIEKAYINARNREEEIKCFFNNIDDLMQARLEEHVFEKLLRNSITQIKCYYDHVDIDTIHGVFTLRRYMDEKYRNFPKFTYRLLQPDNELTKTIVEIEYVYNRSKGRNLIAKFGNLHIYSIK